MQESLLLAGKTPAYGRFVEIFSFGVHILIGDWSIGSFYDLLFAYDGGLMYQDDIAEHFT